MRDSATGDLTVNQASMARKMIEVSTIAILLIITTIELIHFSA
jgi:hypothetical protein